MQEDVNAVTEWHSSVSMETLVSLIPSDASSVVMVGCGNSLLPEAIAGFRPDVHMTLQDSSRSCIQMLQQRHGDAMTYAVGDATKLSQCLVAEGPKRFDVIFDKGLMDALFCNEGWDGPISFLVREASMVLKDNGQYILVSYKLPKSTREFLAEVGQANNLEWTFHGPGSNDSVGVSIAKKRNILPSPSEIRF